MPGTNLERILLVEDDPDIQMVAQMALEAIGGHTVCIAHGGQEAVAKAEEFGPDLILLDVMMPGMDGPAALRALRANPGTASIPVAFMTAKIQPHEKEEYLSLGALEVIAKPFDPMALAGIVEEIWQRHLQEETA